MKILQLAGFTGNIGDNASHYGTYEILKKYFDFTIDTLEIRKTYRNYTLSDKWRFDNEFVKKANKYDLLLIGGGAFFDYIVDDSVTGTTMDITDEILDLLSPQIIVMSMGCLPRGKEHNFKKVSRFLDKLKERAHIFFRNDGSRYPGISQVLDSGFFYDNSGEYRLVRDDYIAVSVADYGTGDVGLYISEVAKLIEAAPKKVVLIPHTLGDVDVINQIIKRIHFFTVASKVIVAPYQQGWEGCRQLFSVYKNSWQVVATRYHANVCSIAMGKPCVGIGASPKVEAMYKTLNSEAVKITPNMSEELINRYGEIHNIEDLKVDTLGKYGSLLGN